jgi:hypothetical protein
MHEQIYFHENTYWRMACVGYRAWAWKRLLVKAVFFDALTKITTRSSLQLSLFESFLCPFPADGTDPDFCNKEIREMISDTKFGELAFKTKHIENNLLRKQVQHQQKDKQRGCHLSKTSEHHQQHQAAYSC